MFALRVYGVVKVLKSYICFASGVVQMCVKIHIWKRGFVKFRLNSKVYLICTRDSGDKV